MARRRKKEEPEAPKGDPSAILSAALNTILLAFFICLTSMATITDQKVMRGIYSIKTAFGVVGGEVSPIEKTFGPLEEYTLEGISHKAIMDLKRFIQKQPLASKIRLGITPRGLIIELSSDLVFPPASAKLNPRIYPILDRIAAFISNCRNKVIIEGYTDSTPIKTPLYPSNWELSMARALSVLNYFVTVKNLPSNRFVAVGYGPTRPIFPNDTPEHRAKNRRVWILIKGTPKPIKEETKVEKVNIKGFFFKIKEFF